MKEIHKYLLDVIDAGYEIHEDPKRFAIYLDHKYGSGTKSYSIEQLMKIAEEEQEHFLGEYESPADYTEEFLRDVYEYELEALPSIIRNGIDWAEIWNRELRHDCFTEEVQFETRYLTFIWHAH